MTTTTTAPTAGSGRPEPACVPRTLDDALFYLAGLWPGAFAVPARLAEFYQHAAEVYAAVKDATPGLKIRADSYADNARRRAEHYAAQASITPAVGASPPNAPAWPMLPPPRAGHRPARRTVGSAR